MLISVSLHGKVECHSSPHIIYNYSAYYSTYIVCMYILYNTIDVPATSSSMTDLNLFVSSALIFDFCKLHTMLAISGSRDETYKC